MFDFREFAGNFGRDKGTSVSMTVRLYKTMRLQSVHWSKWNTLSPTFTIERRAGGKALIAHAR